MLPTHRYAAFLAAIVLLFAFASPTHASPPDPFTGCQSQTGRNASVLLKAPLRFFLAGGLGQIETLASGDMIAAYTPQGLCAGVIVWEDHAALLTVWEDDPLTPIQDGFLPGDPLTLWVWDASSGSLFVGSKIRYEGPFDTTGLYSADAVFAPSAAVFTPSSLAKPGQGAADADTNAKQAEGPTPEALRVAGGAHATAPPDDFVLAASYPNPFRSSTTVRYGLPQGATVRLDVYDALGRRVTTLVDEVQSAGWHEAVLPARGLAAGLYVVRLRAGDFVAVRQITLAR